MDHDREDVVLNPDILFVSDSFKQDDMGQVCAFNDQEENLIFDTLLSTGYNQLDKVAYTPAVKCPAVKERDISASDRNICRSHIQKSIEIIRPKLIFLCGNLAMIMVLKKSGITNKRGNVFDYELADGTKIPVVPIYHPTQVIIEPKFKYLFELDIQNAIEAFIVNSKKDNSLDWEMIDNVESLNKIDPYLDYDVAIDIETTGFDFIKGKIQTIAMSFSTDKGYKTFVFPFNHKDFNDDKFKSELIKYSEKIFLNEKTKKVFHNAKFDMKFLKKSGFPDIVNVYDTKLIHHLIDENLPKSLKDLVNYYFPHEQELIDAGD